MIITYLDVRDSAVSQIRNAFASQPKIKIEGHPGAFGEEEIKRLAQRTPAILVSMLKVSDPDNQDESFAEFVCWVMYRADSLDRLYDGVLKIISALIPVIRGIDADWAYNDGKNIQAESLYSGPLDRLNITLWAVKWKWRLRGPVFDGQEGGIRIPDDLEVFEGYDSVFVVGSAEAEDIVNIE